MVAQRDLWCPVDRVSLPFTILGVDREGNGDTTTVTDAPSQSRTTVVVAAQTHLDRESLLAILRTQPLGDPREVPAAAVIRLALPETRIVAIAPHGADRCAPLNPVGTVVAENGSRLHAEHASCADLALAYGAVRAVSRDASPDELFTAVREAAEGPPWAAPDMLPSHASVNLLTQQESRVARRVGHGDSNKEITTTLRISELTVKKHIGHVLHKLGRHGRLQLGLCVARRPLAFREEPVTRGWVLRARRGRSRRGRA